MASPLPRGAEFIKCVSARDDIKRTCREERPGHDFLFSVDVLYPFDKQRVPFPGNEIHRCLNMLENVGSARGGPGCPPSPGGQGDERSVHGMLRRAGCGDEVGCWSLRAVGEGEGLEWDVPATEGYGSVLRRLGSFHPRDEQPDPS